MIGFLRGRVEEIYEGGLVLDVNGVGYELLVPEQLLSEIGGTGRELKLYTYMQLREDAVVLFGFLTRDDLAMFKMLIGVSGVGPKAGLSIMSALGADELRFAVLADDAKKIAKTPGIGAKTAQKIILDLKDRLDLEDALERKLGADTLTSEAAAAEDGMLQDAVEALVALGYGGTEALRAVRAVELTEDMDVERLLREALRHIR
ncbi:MAG: Holliday junction branch migration protein RuvA [Lachnospiraceae bacterium]|nr:Holliday junction branch migration protein RuvA [Lachnospiraceae bacterium]